MYIITGQTGTGKTKLALELAAKYNGEIINCDSRQIYTHLDIVTGKDISPKSVKSKVKFIKYKSLNGFNIGYYLIGDRTSEVKLWLYDIVNPDQYFSSYDYVRCVEIVINQLIEKGKTPIIVGGSYFYLKHLLYGFQTENIPPDFKLRKKLNDQSVPFLQKTLKKVAPEVFYALNQSDRHNPRRLIRKIEIATAEPPKFYKTVHLKPRRLNEIGEITIIGLKFKNKPDLISVIKKRVEKRLKQGAVDEVKKLISLGYSENDPGLKTIGYKQLFDYLNKKLTLVEATRRWVTAEVQYAKRQINFMKKDKNINWKFI